METDIFTNKQMLKWLSYLADVARVPVDRVKILDDSLGKCNVLPAIETNKFVILFTNGNDGGICYDIWAAGHEKCKVLVGHGLEPTGRHEVLTIADMIEDEIKRPCVLFIENPDARESYKIGIDNDNFARGPIHYVGNEIRAVIMTMLSVDSEDCLLLVSAESIVAEASMMAPEGTIIAVEPDPGSLVSMRENVEKFGLRNVPIVTDVKKESLKDLPTPRLSFIVATEELEDQIRDLLKKNPKMQFIIYTLELDVLSQIKGIFERHGIHNLRVTQITVAKTNEDSMFVTQPTPWLIMGEA